MIQALYGLNEAQTQAVTATEGYIRVIAGAGSGKTRALAHRYAYLVNDIGIMPENILCVTFTNKSANEMRKRIRRLTVDADTGYISTFHSFCVTVLQEDINVVHYPRSFIVLDNADIDAMLAVVYEERNLTMRHMTFSQSREMIEIKKIRKEPNYYQLMLSLTVEELRQKYLSCTEPEDIIFWGYVYQEKKCFALDYNDLINFVLYIFSVSDPVREKWQNRLEYIMIDEYQDIDELQCRLMKALCPVHNNLFVVGDPDQTIYTWRGASVGYILNFEKEFPNVRTIMMNENYRSTPEIINTANSLIAKNSNRIPKNLRAIKQSSDKTVFCNCKTTQEEALWAAAEIKRLNALGTPLRDIAFLYRAHYLTRTFEDVFLKEEIPYTIYSGVQFFERMEIKDALSYLRMVIYRDDLSFARVANLPKRNLGEKRMKFLRAFATEHNCSLYTALVTNMDNEIMKGTKAKSFVDLVESFADKSSQMVISELLTLLLDKSGYEAMLRLEGAQNRLDNLAELLQAIREYEDNCGEECTAEDYLDRIALMTNNDVPDSKNAVKMMTVHTAKGLEFPVVFIVDLNETVFPSKRTSSLEGMEEERRLAFVAATRAQERLYLLSAEGRNMDGSYRYPSRFIFNIDKDTLNFVNELDPRLVDEAVSSIDFSMNAMKNRGLSSNFKPGDRITHSIWGLGTILRVEDIKNAYVVLFDNFQTERTLSFRTKLTPVH